MLEKGRPQTNKIDNTERHQTAGRTLTFWQNGNLNLPSISMRCEYVHDGAFGKGIA